MSERNCLLEGELRSLKENSPVPFCQPKVTTPANKENSSSPVAIVSSNPFSQLHDEASGTNPSAPSISLMTPERHPPSPPPSTKPRKPPSPAPCTKSSRPQLKVSAEKETVTTSSTSGRSARG